MNIWNKYKSILLYNIVNTFGYAFLIVVSLISYTIYSCFLNFNNISSLHDVYNLMCGHFTFIPVFIYLFLLHAYIDFSIYKSGGTSVGVIIRLCIYLTDQFFNVLFFTACILFSLCIIKTTNGLGMTLTLAIYVVLLRDPINMFWLLHGSKVRYYSRTSVLVLLPLGLTFYIFEPEVLVDIWNNLLQLATSTRTPIGACWVLPPNTATPELIFPENYKNIISMAKLLVDELGDLDILGKEYVDTLHKR